MKRITITIITTLLIILFKSGYSQSSFLPADWRQGDYYSGNFFQCPRDSPRLLIHSGDTTTGGFTYAVLENYNLLPQSYFTPYYARKQAGRIFVCEYSLTSPERVIYDFSLNVNDTLTLLQSFWHNGLYTVDSTYNVTLLNAASRKYMVLHGSDTWNAGDTLRWIEDIGDIDDGFLAEGDFEGGHLSFICHKENAQLLWTASNPAVDCDSITVIPTGMNDLSNETLSLELIPNPFHDLVQLKTNYRHQLEICFFDVDSRKLLQRSVMDSDIIHLEFLPNGIYFYEVRNESTILKSGKIAQK